MPVWGGASKKHISRLQAIINKTARFITGAGKRTKTRELMEKCQWLTVDETIRQKTAIFMWNLVWKQLPEHMHKKISVNQQNLIERDQPRLQATMKSIRWKGTEVWNQLPEVVRNNNQIRSFETELKTWILENRRNQQE